MAAAPPASGNIALLIDADNASPASLDPVLTVLAELGTVNIRRVYGNWKKPALKTWADKTLSHGIEPYQQFDLTKGKNATDMKMTIDAMDLLFGGRVTGFGIMSSDSDFTPLAMRIRQEGIPVYGFGTMKTPEGFREACTRFIDVAALTKSHEAEMPAAPAKAESGVDPALLTLLIDAYNAAKRDERGFAALSEIGSLAGNRSSFDVRNYGFKRLSDLMKKVPNFQSELRDGRMFVKRIN
ncbi:NYN domain-containing protein [Sphingomonas sp. AOB5]|uniref:NYN domain-containing protein n=1 Tax=Sphingomonas sp. AOB5 TaxID=3034017 RepID=UPI0023F951A7|nr:NYN domain-containing protein [Sphingomonas sp. AOB5]MDF7774480.1 NYN domain-containing protein [Sphingomonas sp. AOB5]